MEMDFAASAYCRLNRVLLSFVGLWPYKNSRLVKAQRLVYPIIMASGIVFQFTTFATTEYSLELLLEILSFSVLTVIYIVKYLTFAVNSRKVKATLDLIQSNWDGIESEQEREIVRTYARKGQVVTMLFASFIYPGTVAFIGTELIPDFLNWVAPLNESRRRKHMLRQEYFVDEHEYYYQILIHVNFIVIVGSTTLLATETTFMVFIQQACGLYKIVCYRIENALGATSSEAPGSPVVTTKVINAVKMHERALQFSDAIKAGFMTSYFVLLSLGTASLTLNLFAFSQSLLDRDNTVKMLFRLLLTSSHFAYIFYANYLGQQIINHSNDVYEHLCRTQWYLAPLSTQKLLLFIMQRSMKSYTLTAGSVFVPSLEGFSTMTSMSMSYFMVMYSTSNPE